MSRKAIGIGIAVTGAVAAAAGIAALTGRKSSGQTAGVGPLGRALPASQGSVVSHGKTLRIYQKKEFPIAERIALLQDLVAKGVTDPEMRKLALQITRNCEARDAICECRAIYNWTRENIRYTGDIAPHKTVSGPIEAVDLFQSAQRTIEFGGGDCFSQGTLMLAQGHRLVPVESLEKGMKIWGHDRWSEVVDVWAKGILPFDAIFLNNGSSFKLTRDHKVWVALCKRHPVSYENANPCSCPVAERDIVRVPVAELVPEMVMLQPKQIPFGTEEMDPGRAYVEGLYLSDGSSGHDSSFEIAGQDGCPKEEQKREVEAICARLGVNTTWQRKYISVRNREWADRTHRMGTHAPFKHALSINLAEATAREYLRGIMADSGANTNGNGRTFTSTSRELTLQTRLLHRMFGRSCSERYIVDHGGLGENPIWRLGVRDTRSDVKAEKLPRVKRIERDVFSLPAWDITTDDHKVYLPEADVSVSQCDDHAVLNSVLLIQNGIPAILRITARSPGPQPDWSHIYAVGVLPKIGTPRQYVPLDSTLPGDYFSKEYPFGKKIDAIA